MYVCVLAGAGGWVGGLCLYVCALYKCVLCVFCVCMSMCVGVCVCVCAGRRVGGTFVCMSVCCVRMCVSVLAG